MANTIKGEVDTNTGHRMVFDFNAMAELEDITGRRAQEVLAKFDNGTATMTELRAFYLACLRRYHPDLTIYDAGDIVAADPEAWVRASNAAKPDVPESSSGNGKARRTKAG